LILASRALPRATRAGGSPLASYPVPVPVQAVGVWRFPVGAYPALYRVFFTFVVPVAFLTTVPAEAALKRGEAPLLLAGGLALLLFLLARGFFLLALRSYTSASS